MISSLVVWIVGDSIKGKEQTQKVRLYPRPVRISEDGGPPRYPVKEVLAKLRAFIFRGDGVECPCCGKTFSHFLFSPYYTARCPFCLSMERYRLLCKFLRDETDFGKREMRLLEVGPDWSFQEFCRDFEKVEYTSADLFSPLAMERIDIRNMDFESSSFDFIICYHVLEHIDDDMKALRELHRVLKPDGQAIIQVPIQVPQTVERDELGKKEQEEILKWPDHLRAYGPDFRERLENSGFDVRVIPFGKKFSPEEIERFGLSSEEDIYFCTKREAEAAKLP